MITAAGHQQQRLLAVQLLHQHGTVAGQLLSLGLAENRGPLTLGDDHAGQLAAGLIDRRQGRQHAVVVGREQHPHHVAHFPQQRLAEGGVLVRLLVLAVLPGMRGRHQRPTEPAGRTPGLFLLTSENQALAHRTEHLHAEGFIAGDQIKAALVGQTRRHHRLLVEGGDDFAVHCFHGTFRRADPMLKRFQHATQAITGQLIGIADPRAQAWVGGDQFNEEAIQGRHRRAVLVVVMQGWQLRCGGMTAG